MIFCMLDDLELFYLVGMIFLHDFRRDPRDGEWGQGGSIRKDNEIG